MKNVMWKRSAAERRSFVGGSDARVIMGSDEKALLRLWREKAARSNQKIYPAIWWFSSGLPPRT
jgi:predicted phage-related endonuclease